MTWQTDIILEIRALIGDLDPSNQTYTDSRLTSIAVIAANQVLNDVDFYSKADNSSTGYKVDVNAQTISPDPTTLNPPDIYFVNLVSLKGAALVLTGELRKYALSNVIVMDGPSQMNMAGIFQSMKSTLSFLHTEYNRSKALYLCGNNGQAVTTPTTVNNVFPIQDF